MTKDGELALGVNMSEAVKDNLGFAPVYDSSFSGRNPNINGYACVTGFFNQDYKNVEAYKNNYENISITKALILGLQIIHLLSLLFMQKL